MGISRLHIALLSIMSFFTGIIAPGTSIMGTQVAYPMTDARIFSYILLFSLIIGFYTASIHTWRFFRYNALFIFGMTGILFFLTLSGQITETKTGIEAHGLSWGWIFLFIGVILLFKAYKGSELEENNSELRQTIDTLLGIVGSFTLACIAGVIVLISLSFTDKSYKESILERTLGTGSLTYMSGGIILSAAYTDIPKITYDRKTDVLIASTKKDNEWGILVANGNSIENLNGGTNIPIFIKEKLYMMDASGNIFSGSTQLTKSILIGDDDTIIFQSGSSWKIESPKSSWTLDYSGELMKPSISGDRMILAWIEYNDGKYQVFKMGKAEGERYDIVHFLNVSQGGYDTMALVALSGGLHIMKNGSILWNVESGFETGSYISNGSHSIYTVNQDKQKRIVYDGQTINTPYDEVRELFLEKNGGYYSYFAKPIGGIKYCLFTKYRGNLCGLDGYMNPRLSPDGSSIIYAGYKDGVWGIYRNTEVLVKNTGYSNVDISNDYAFFDITNPRTYLFVKKDSLTGKYSLIKNGKILPGLWDDFGTEVSFGYDNHIILKLKDTNGWRIAEL